jgi:sialidase-1
VLCRGNGRAGGGDNWIGRVARQVGPAKQTAKSRPAETGSGEMSSGNFRSFRLSLIVAVIIAAAARAGFAAEPVFTDVFVAAEDGFNTIRIPSIAVTTHGVLLAFAEGRLGAKSDQAQNKIICKRSSDSGLTWTPVAVVADDGENSLNNPTAVVDRSTGRVFLMYQRIPAHMTEASKAISPGLDGPMIYRNFLLTSDDDGKTWSVPADVTRTTKHPTVATTVASGPGIGIQLTRGPHKGRLIFPFNEGPFYKWNNFAVYSDDDGASWKVGDNAPGNMKGARSMVNEVQMVELEDGSVMLNSRQFAGAKCRKISVSRDGGETWSPIADAPELRDPSCMASILRYSFSADGHPGVVLYSGPDADKRINGTVYISEDDGKSWPIKRTLVPGSFSYSVLVKLPDNSVGCLFEGASAIQFARFDPAWVREGVAK